MLSLSKLSALASEVDTSQLIESINSALTLIDHQEQLPAELLTDVFGYDINCMKVLEVEELIALYVSPDNSLASEAEFRKALELLTYVDEDDVDDVRHKIWCAAILRDSWINCHSDETATEFIAGTMFFKLIDMCHFLDGNLDMLPPIEQFLRASELAAITNNQAFQYLLKLGYEQIEYGK
jgi:nuclear pore complex protein Nup133